VICVRFFSFRSFLSGFVSSEQDPLSEKRKEQEFTTIANLQFSTNACITRILLPLRVMFDSKERNPLTGNSFSFPHLLMKFCSSSDSLRKSSRSLSCSFYFLSHSSKGRLSVKPGILWYTSSNLSHLSLFCSSWIPLHWRMFV
jgi:hypothetical protein